ncbi:hypothetical protein BOTBODRAFT_181747 [Botryobasidium botryosum FD-172 SS1]|uniref:Uncharacterized protein n=1 Tax=Botryobasidium botryosum (strain FD-172 SS1) TaxID=930990 RepID=A0A067LSQ6_BOTB1|nr:hypothetical protein BOTBODRAFT_181747 [Botryobasidium botryosum FD-172 SS1]
MPSIASSVTPGPPSPPTGQLARFAQTPKIMDAIALNSIPQLMQNLYEHILQNLHNNVEQNTPSGQNDTETQFLELLSHQYRFTGFFRGTSSPKITTQQRTEAVNYARTFAVDAIMSHADHMLYMINKGHNETQPIFRLPVEILAAIFQHATYTDPERSVHSVSANQGAFTISHVSSLWREVALSLPGLWATISSSSSIPYEICLSRAKGAPLHIEIDDQSASANALMHALRSHMDHWESLVLQCPNLTPETLQEWIGLPGPAPQLKLFRARFWRPSDFVLSPNMTRPDIFANHTPRLRVLHLDGIYISLYSPIYANLTSIHLATVSCFAPPEHLVHVLANCPLLEVLCLFALYFFGAPPNTTTPVPAPAPFIHLARLHLLSLKLVDHEAVQCILASIRVPLSLVLHVAMSFEDISEVFLPGVDVEGNFPNISAARSITVHPDFGAPPRISITLCSEAGGESHFTAIGISGDGNPDELMVLVLGSLVRLPLPNLVCLIINSMFREDLSSTFNAALCRGLLEPVSSITSIALLRCSRALVEALAITPTLHLWPQLDSIHLESFTILRDDLLRVLQSRALRGPHAHLVRERSGAYLRRVIFAKPVDPELVQAVRALGITVEFA